MRILLSVVVVFVFVLLPNQMAQASPSEPIPVPSQIEPLHQVFNTDDIDIFGQSWSVDFDDFGRVILANSYSVAVFDGMRWEQLHNNTLGIMRSAVVTDDGRIFVGGQNAIGVYTPDDKGNWAYQAIETPEALGRIGVIAQGIQVRDNVYFATGRYLLKVSADLQVEATPSTERVTVGVTDNLSWASVPGHGVIDLETNQRLPVDGQGNARIVGIVLSDERYMFVYRDGSIEKLTVSADGKRVDREPIVNDELAGQITINARQLPEGLGVTTAYNGLVVIGDKGETLSHVKLRESWTLDVGLHNGSLWLAHDGDVIRVPWPIQAFKVISEVWKGQKFLYAIAKQDREIYVGGNKGLIRYDEQERTFNLLELKSEESPTGTGTVWAMLSTGPALMIASQTGTYLYKPGNMKLLAKGAARAIYALHDPQDYYLVASETHGLYLFKQEEGDMRQIDHVSEMAVEIQKIVQEANGSIWLSSRRDGIYHIAIKEEGGMEVLNLPSEDLIPVDRISAFPRVFSSEGNAYVAVNGKVCRLTRHPQLGCEFEETFSVVTDSFFATSSESGRLFFLNYITGVPYEISRQGDSFARRPAPYDDMPASDIAYVFETEQFDWIARPDGLWLVQNSERETVKGAETWIQGLEVDQQWRYRASTLNNRLTDPVEYEHAVLRFYFATNNYLRSDETYWRSRLKGINEGFSEWTKESWKDFTVLSGGDYTLEFQMRDRTSKLSPVEAFHFTVLSPWYLTNMAYMAYLVMFLVVFYLSVQSYSKRKTRALWLRQKELEFNVKERTQEIAHKNQVLADQARKLDALDQAKSRFFANITHEFRTPLTLTLGPLEDILDGRCGNVSEPVVKSASQAKKSAQQLLSLIEELLDIARLDSGALPINGQKVNLTELCRLASSQLHSLAEKKDVSLSMESTSDSIELIADPRHFMKVLTNLLANAIKFTPSGGNVSLSVKQEGQEALVSVEDTGDGIDERKLAHVFERFYQVRDSSENLAGGVGIGLSLAKEITELHGGSISVSSTKGQGTKFSIRLPLDTGLVLSENVPFSDINDDNYDEVVDGAIVYSFDSNIENRETIVLVEDNQDLREFIAGHLNDRYNVITCENGAEGLASAKTHLPDLIISDVMMPVMNGIEMCSSLKSDVETDFIPIILLTAKVTDSDRIEGYEAGADDYLLKPFSTEVLNARVVNLIASRKKLLMDAREAHIVFPDTPDLMDREQMFVEQCKQHIQENLSDNRFNVEKLASLLNMERTTLYKKVQAAFDTSPSKLIIKARLAWARQLLESDTGNVAEVAFTVGYNSVSHFSSSFRTEFGVSPTQVKK